jgi:hypothetical protein
VPPVAGSSFPFRSPLDREKPKEYHFSDGH